MTAAPRSNKTSKLTRLWLLVPVVAAAEIALQLWIPSREPSLDDWAAVAEEIGAARQPGDLVIIAPDWAVQGRMHLKDFIDFKDFGRFDTTTYRRILEVRIDGARSPETEGLTPVATVAHGTLALSTYELPAPDQIIYSFTDEWRQGKYEKTPRRPPKLVIDHWFHPRRVLEFDLRSRSAVTFEDVPLNGVLRGYAIIGYREGRFNKGGPIRLRVLLNDALLGENRVANFSPIAPFSYTLPGAGKGIVRFEVLARDNKKREFGIHADIRQPGGDR